MTTVLLDGVRGNHYPYRQNVFVMGMMCVFCILLGTIELWLVLKTGSVFPAAMMHETVIAISVVTALIWIYDRKHERIMSKEILQHIPNQHIRRLSCASSCLPCACLQERGPLN